jgi:hypothetical protein
MRHIPNFILQVISHAIINNETNMQVRTAVNNYNKDGIRVQLIPSDDRITAIYNIIILRVSHGRKFYTAVTFSTLNMTTLTINLKIYFFNGSSNPFRAQASYSVP